ncbi:MAG: DUF3798 domain-containing protein [Firmicutes bacterium]|jgi:hypothetical protein|nr:DUF3798 domain-containing protein [Bacillota bacterium]HPU00779.1 DUF3798 domain-containing protein [Bacillota bacterium]
MKKALVLLLLVGLAFGLFGCGTKTPGDSEGVDFKIGIVTGTVSQGEEEFRAAQELVKKYGSDMIVHITYPDKFMDEQETTIANIVGLAADPKIKAIIINQGVPGSAAAIKQIKETRDDILFIVGVPHEDPAMIAAEADICINTDDLKRGETIVALAEQLGAKTFIHYSFPRHMAMELLAQRRDIFREECEKRGIQFVEVEAPDPTGDAGVTGAQQFILEDVPRQIEKYGKDTNFFSTNCAMQEPLIKSALEGGAIFAEQCCPSPYHAYPGALGIEIPEEKAGDVDYILEQITAKIVEKGGAGRFATWKVPANMAMIYGSAEYAILYAKGEVGKQDFNKFQELMGVAAKGDVILSPLEGSPNFLMFVGESIIFGAE